MSSGPSLSIVTAAERPDLVERARTATRDTLPEYNNHGTVLNRYWNRLVGERPEFQLHLVEGDEPVARVRAVPVRWDGTVDDLPAGIDGAIARGFEEPGANTLCALLIAVRGSHQGRGLSRIALEAMAALARRHGFGALIAPVRPSWKSATRPCRSRAMHHGGAGMASSSTPGFESMSGSAPRYFDRSRTP